VHRDDRPRNEKGERNEKHGSEHHAIDEVERGGELTLHDPAAKKAVAEKAAEAKRVAKQLFKEADAAGMTINVHGCTTFDAFREMIDKLATFGRDAKQAAIDEALGKLGAIRREVSKTSLDMAIDAVVASAGAARAAVLAVFENMAGTALPTPVSFNERACRTRDELVAAFENLASWFREGTIPASLDPAFAWHARDEFDALRRWCESWSPKAPAAPVVKAAAARVQQQVQQRVQQQQQQQQQQGGGAPVVVAGQGVGPAEWWAMLGKAINTPVTSPAFMQDVAARALVVTGEDLADPAFKKRVVDAYVRARGSDVSNAEKRAKAIANAIKTINNPSKTRGTVSAITGALFEAKVEEVAEMLAMDLRQLQRAGRQAEYDALLRHVFRDESLVRAIVAKGAGVGFVVPVNPPQSYDVRLQAVDAATGERLATAIFECKAEAQMHAGTSTLSEVLRQGATSLLDDDCMHRFWYTITNPAHFESGKGYIAYPATIGWAGGVMVAYGVYQVLNRLHDVAVVQSHVFADGTDVHAVTDGQGNMVGDGMLVLEDSKSNVRGLITFARDAATGAPLPMANFDAFTREFVATYAVREYQGATTGWDGCTLDDKDFEIGGVKGPLNVRLAYAYKNGLPLDTVQRTGGTKQSLEAGDKVWGKIGKRVVSGTVQHVIGDVVDVKLDDNSVPLPTGTPVTIATTSGDWTGTITAGLTVAQYNLAKALDASKNKVIDGKIVGDYRNIPGYVYFDPKLGHVYTPAEQASNLQKILERADILFSKDPVHVTFSLGFLVGGPHADLVALARLFRI